LKGASRPLSELKIRATTHACEHNLQTIASELLEDIAEGKISPTRAFNLVYSKTLCKECAKCARWLAIIARDYGVDDAKNTLKLML
jgi:hypothetical protein